MGDVIRKAGCFTALHMQQGSTRVQGQGREGGGGVHLHCGRYLLITSRLASLSSGTCSPSFSVHVEHEGVGNGAKGDRWDGTAGRGVFVVSGTRAFY